MTIPEQSHPIDPETLDRSGAILAERYHELAGVALQHARSILRNPHQAEEVAQETIFKVYKAGGLANVENLPGYVATTAQRTAFDLLRRYAVLEILPYEHLEGINARSREMPTPEITFEHRDTVERVSRALDRLKQEFSATNREIIRLTAEGMRAAEIGEIFNMSPDSVRSRLCRSRAKLNEYLREEES